MFALSQSGSSALKLKFTVPPGTTWAALCVWSYTDAKSSRAKQSLGSLTVTVKLTLSVSVPLDSANRARRGRFWVRTPLPMRGQSQPPGSPTAGASTTRL